MKPSPVFVRALLLSTLLLLAGLSFASERAFRTENGGDSLKRELHLNQPNTRPGVFDPSITAMKSVDKTSAKAGDTLTYTVTISNSGTNASNVVFTDTIDANTTLVPVSVSVSPIAVNDAYTAIGNVGISVPVAQGLLANDFNPGGSGTLTVTNAGNLITSNGGAVTLNADGSFTYNPAAGFRGPTDSFTYTLGNGTGKTDTGTVVVTINGMIWFIDNSLSMNGNGRLSNPFNNLPAFAAINNGTGSNPAAGDNIFVFRQVATDYAGPLTLLNNQKLIGQGATASLATMTGLTPPSYSVPLPATGGTNPAIAASVTNITLASGNTVQGVTLSNSGGTALTGNNFGTFTAADDIVTNSSGPAINLTTGNLAASFITVSSTNSSTTGINLATTTGSFSVSGVGSTAGSGGTIQGTTNNGITLNSVTNVSFNLMTIQNVGGHGLGGVTVTGFSLTNSTISDTVTNITPADSVNLSGLLGTNTISSVSFNGINRDGISVTNSSGTLTSLTISNSTFQNHTAPNGNNSVQIVANGNAIMTTTITGGTFTHNVNAEEAVTVTTASNYTGTNNVIVQNATFNAGAAFGSGGIVMQADGTGTGNYRALNNTINLTPLTGIAVEANGNSTVNAVITGNSITPRALANGGNGGDGIAAISDGTGGTTAQRLNVSIQNNVVGAGFALEGIFVQLRQGNSSASLSLTLVNNSVGAPALPLVDGIRVLSQDAGTLCARISSNTSAGGAGAVGLRAQRSVLGSTTFNLERGSAALASPAATVLMANNAASTTAATGTITVVENNTCAAAPTVARAIEEEYKRPTLNARSAKPVSLHPQLSAFADYTPVVRFQPVIKNAPSLTTPGTHSGVMAGETIMLTLGMLPQGESITIMFQVTIGAPLPAGTTQISNAATVSGTGFTPVTTNTAITTITLPPTIMKAFGAADIPLDGTTSLTFTLTNPNTQALLTGIAFTDSLPAGLVIANPNGLNGVCGGTVTANPDSGSISLTGGTLAANGSCMIAVNVTGKTAGTKNNTSEAISSTEGGTGPTSNTASINVVSLPPRITKDFGGAQATNLVFVLTTTNALARVSASTPGTLLGSPIPITGLAAGDTLVAIDFRPATGRLYGLGINGAAAHLYTINVTTATATQVGVSIALPQSAGVTGPGTRFGLDFNPIVDRIRVVSDCGDNFRLNPDTGAVASADTALNPAPTSVVAAAYTNNFAGASATTLYDIDSAVDRLFVQGGNPVPPGVSPNTGTLTLVGSLGVDSSNEVGFDIASDPGGTAYASLQVAGVSQLYTVNLGSGAATLVGSFGGGITARDISVFSSAQVPVGGTTILNFRITNPNATLALTGLSFTDTLLDGLAVDASPIATNTCGGTFNPAAGDTMINLSGGMLAGGATCTLSVKVKATTAGLKINITGAVSAEETGAGNTGSDNLTVVAPQTISKAFGAASIPLAASTSLTFTINNPNTSSALTGVAFSDNLPAGLVVNTPNGLNGVCGGSVTATPATGTISLSNGTLAAGGSCMIVVNVRGTTAGTKNNTTGTISSSEGGTGAVSNTATLAVAGPPAITKAFGAANIPLNGTTSLTFAISNPNTASAMSGVAFTDSLPAGLVVATPNGLSGVCGGMVTAAPGSGSISLTGGTLAAGGSCMIVVDVTGTTSGVKNNTTGNVTSTEGGTGNTASASVLVVAPPTLMKAFGATDIALNSITLLTFTLSNPGTIPLTAVAFNDILPAGLVVDTPNGRSTTCSGTLSTREDTGLISLTGGTLGVGASCTLSLRVKGVTAGLKSNTTGPVRATESGPGATSNTALLAVHPITISIADPVQCLGPGGVVGVTASVTNSSGSPQLVNFTATLPAGLSALPGSCMTSVGTCTVVNAGTVTVTANLAAAQMVTVKYQAAVGDVRGGTQLCIDSVATFGAGSPVSVQACTRVNCPLLGEGDYFPSSSEISDQKAGSILVYPIYTSSASMPAQQNTMIHMTNVHPSQSVFTHLFFVDGGTCSIADQFVCLTAQQTVSFSAAELDPGTTGFLIAVAVDQTGCPRNFNYLIGDLYVKFASGHMASVAAESISAMTGALPPCDDTSLTATLPFDGVIYSALPRVLAADNIPDRASGNDTVLVLNRIGGNLLGATAPLGNIFGLLFNDVEQSFSFSFNPGRCQLLSPLSNSFPRTTPNFESVIPRGRSGWMKFWGTDDVGILGVVINSNRNAATDPSAYNQGRNLHKLRLTYAPTLTMPIFPPTC